MLYLGHAGTFAAHYTGKTLKAKIEITKEWEEYVKLSPKERVDQTDLLSKALVQAYLDLDDDLRSYKELNLMVSTLLSLSLMFSVS